MSYSKITGPGMVKSKEEKTEANDIELPKRFSEEAPGSFVAQLTNLHNFTTYKLAVSAVTKSTKAPGKLYESQFSSYHQIFVSPGCTVPSEMVSVFARFVN